MPGPSALSATGATAAPPFGGSQGRGPARYTRPGCAHGYCASARTLSHCVFHSRATAAHALAGSADLVWGALSSLPYAEPRGFVPRRCAPLFAAPAPLAPRAFSQFVLFILVFVAEPVALGERLGGFSCAPAPVFGFFVYA